MESALSSSFISYTWLLFLPTGYEALYFYMLILQHTTWQKTFILHRRFSIYYKFPRIISFAYEHIFTSSFSILMFLIVFSFVKIVGILVFFMIFVMTSNIICLMPAVCPTIQFNSDTSYPQLVKIPQVKALSPPRLPPHQVLGVPNPPTLLSGWIQIWDFPQHPQVGNSLDPLTELRKVLYLQSPLYYEGYLWIARGRDTTLLAY